MSLPSCSRSLPPLRRCSGSEHGLLEVLTGWYDGFWMLLEFGMQMVLILATGYAIALSAPVARLIDRLALRITRPGQSI